MKTFTRLLAVLMLPLAFAGCSAAAKESDESAPRVTAPINNSAPEAQGAPAAPGPGPDVPRPGGKRMPGGKR